MPTTTNAILFLRPRFTMSQKCLFLFVFISLCLFAQCGNAVNDYIKNELATFVDMALNVSFTLPNNYFDSTTNLNENNNNNNNNLIHILPIHRNSRVNFMKHPIVDIPNALLSPRLIQDTISKNFNPQANSAHGFGMPSIASTLQPIKLFFLESALLWPGGICLENGRIDHNSRPNNYYNFTTNSGGNENYNNFIASWVWLLSLGSCTSNESIQDLLSNTDAKAVIVVGNSMKNKIKFDVLSQKVVNERTYEKMSFQFDINEFEGLPFCLHNSTPWQDLFKSSDDYFLNTQTNNNNNNNNNVMNLKETLQMRKGLLLPNANYFNESHQLCYISILVVNRVDHKNLDRTSILFVSISFILLLILSLAWLIFYYVQRFRYIHTKKKFSRRLANLARKALARIPVKTVKVGDRLTNHELYECPVCIEGYEPMDNIRILPCKHMFHKVCVDPWLLEMRSCPMCKLDIVRACGLQMSACSGDNVGSLMSLDEEESYALATFPTTSNNAPPNSSDPLPLINATTSSSSAPTTSTTYDV